VDFSRILDQWERGQSSKPGQVPNSDPGKDVEPAVRVTRAEIEAARHEAVLDLHGLSRDAAVASLREFLGSAVADGLRKVLVIHGKGLHSDDGRGVLSDAVREVLSKNRNVAAWGQAAGKQGGRGASWVWLSARGK
jgi:DNA-nicking Smr family endonuclease